MDAPDTIAEKIRTGEYFREAKRTYADMYLDPMAERYFYVLITGISLLICVITLYAILQLYPLAPQVPFTYPTQNIDEEMPVISPLAAKSEPPNLALKRYLASEYVRRREAYDINSLEINVRVVRNLSDDAVYSAWQKELDPANPQSPIAQFERHTTRGVRVLSVLPLPDGHFEVTYEATLHGDGADKKAVYSANMAFRFAEVTVNQRTGQATPVAFTVTEYQTRRVEE